MENEKQAWEDNKWERPQLEEKVQPDFVTLTFQLKTTDSYDIVPSLSPVCPQFVPSLSPVKTNKRRNCPAGITFIAYRKSVYLSPNGKGERKE